MSNVVDFRKWKAENKLSPEEKELELEIIRTEEFQARIERLRQSIDRINSLVDDLRPPSKREERT